MPTERLWTTNFVLVCLANFTVFTSFNLLLPTLPIYVQLMGGGALSIGLINGIFVLASISLRPFVGRQLDKRGRTKILVASAVGFLISAILYNFTKDLWSLMFLRLLHGATWATATTATHALIADLAPPPRRGEAMGYFGISASLSMAIGPLMGLLITGSRPPFRFTTLFIIMSGIALLNLILASRVREPEREQVHFIQKETGDFRPALLPAFTMTSLTFAFGTIVTFLPLYAQVRGVGNIGWFFTLYAFSVMLARPLAGQVSDVKGRAVVIIPGAGVAAVAISLLIFSYGLPPFLLVAVLFGLGFGATHPCLMALTVDVIPKNMQGFAMAIFAAAYDLGMGLGAMLSGFVLQVAGYSAMYLFSAGIILAGQLVFAWGLKGQPKKFAGD